MPALRRVVVTGIGLVTPIGLDVTTFRESLRADTIGVRALRLFDASREEVRIGAEIEGFDAKQYLDKKERKTLKMMARTVQLAVAAARLALAESKTDPAALDSPRFGVVLGAGAIPGDLADLGEASQASWDSERGHIDWRRWGTVGMAQLPPMWMLNHVPNMPACHVSILSNAQGPNNTVTQSDAAGLLAVGEAVRIIERGAADIMLTGGADTRTNLSSVTRFSLFAELSRRNDDPARACRPFDIKRDGEVLGEGAGILLIESLEHAQKRGAPIIAEILGFASGFDCGRKGPALGRVFAAALRNAGVRPGDIDHVNAHAGGLTEADAWEARGIHDVFGMDVPVVALKSRLGNSGAAAGIIELAGSILALQDGIVPATLNCDTLDPACPIAVQRVPRPAQRSCVLKVSLTDRGQCGALVVERWKEN